MVTIEVLTGPPGSGKSTEMLTQVAGTPGRYLWAAPITELIDEQAPRLRELAPAADVLALHCRAKLKGGVGRNIADLPQQYSVDRHVGAFITHEGLLGADPRAFEDWHIRIDETPNGIASGVLKIPHSVDLLRANYDLEPMTGSGWSRVVPRDRSLNWSHLSRDDFGMKLANFHTLASRPRGVIIGLDDWDDARDQGGVEWLSIWTPAELTGCASVTLTGAGYFDSLAYRVTEACFGDQVGHIRTPARNSRRTGQPNVRIHYFTETHPGTTTYWSTSQGRWCLVQVCDWLVKNVRDLGFFSGNEVIQMLFEHRVRGQIVKPKLAGLNALRDHRSCAFIYSSKAVSEDKPLKSVFGLDDDDIVAARETEDIIQFVFRGAIRNPNYDGPYDIYLYHRHQAEAVAAAMLKYSIFDVDIISIPDSPIMETSVEGASSVAEVGDSAKLARKREQDRIRSKRYRENEKERARSRAA
ncbi:hypothetical protein [Rhizobium sp.]|uniref:hypothetical protein n=1 Tax=Rhizobium sp. TaxID=391 RepID=UPI0034C6179B